jgi:hypothetical protein
MRKDLLGLVFGGLRLIQGSIIILLTLEYCHEIVNFMIGHYNKYNLEKGKMMQTSLFIWPCLRNS